MATVFDVAKYILEQLGPLSTMKLQKLCYYAQAWSLAWDEEPLFPHEFEAWVNGPVCRELFIAIKGENRAEPVIYTEIPPFLQTIRKRLSILC